MLPFRPASKIEDSSAALLRGGGDENRGVRRA